MVLVVMPWGLWVGKYEVTQAEFQKVMGANPSKSVQDRQPVEQVSWNDAAEFCRKLTALERNVLRPGQAYSLPTQQQWTEFAGGLRFQDLPRGGFSGRAAPSAVGQSGPPNKFGLFDVLGNVWEWCLDGGTADAKLLKGGAFNKKDAYEQMLPPGGQMSNCGFRCVLASQ
jgi:formylglycine-generating enzyme required for sulfatase activity